MLKIHPTTKYIIRGRLITFIYPDPEYIKEHPTECNEIKQYLTNLLNLCETIADMFDVLPKPLHSVLPNLQYRNGSEDSLLFKEDFNEFKKKSEIVNKKLNKLLTRKLLTS